MYISDIKIKNFRSLKDFSIKLENILSIVIGRNNTGKSSFFIAVDKFINKGQIDFYDINTKFRDDLIEFILSPIISEEYFNEKYSNNPDANISFEFVVNYDDGDNLMNLSQFITDLDVDNKIVCFKIKFIFTYTKYKELLGQLSHLSKQDNSYKRNYLKKHLVEYLVLKSYSYYGNEDNDNIHEFNVKNKDLQKLLHIDIIKAPRDFVKNNSKTLSEQSNRFFELKKQQKADIIEKFSESIEDIDEKLKKEYTKIYTDIFSDIVIYIDDRSIKPEVVSELSADNLIKENTVVKYKDDLPEYYNGLGYLNVISMLFEIHLCIEKYKDIEKPDIYLLFIEEPEAHTHPQLQYIFIKNIKLLLKKQNFQSIISSHSSHIISKSDFNDIKYFYFDSDVNSVNVKNIYELGKIFNEDEEVYKFLKKYLTLSCSELFFASKVIFIEGDTERILLPAFLKKISSLEGFEDVNSQNISVISVGGAYAHKWKPFIDFFDIKSLIITDLDYHVDDKNCADLSKNISNSTIKNLINLNSANDFIKKDYREVEKDKLYVTYQRDGTRSFEDSFWKINKDFITLHKEDFSSLKCIDKLDNYCEHYGFAENFVKKKTDFAIDILFYSDECFSNWKIPEYIEEGLKWLLK